MRDIIPPAVARDPAEAVELASVAVSDGDLDAAVAQYEREAVLVIWREPMAAAGPPAGALRAVMELRLPVGLRVHAVVPAGDVALLLTEHQVAGTGPDCEHIELSGRGAAVVRRQPGGGWRIAADVWGLAGQGRPGGSPRAPGRFP